MTLGEIQVEWKSEHTECVAALAQDPEGIALSHSLVTVAQSKNSQIRIAIDPLNGRLSILVDWRNYYFFKAHLRLSRCGNSPAHYKDSCFI